MEPYYFLKHTPHLMSNLESMMIFQANTRIRAKQHTHTQTHTTYLLHHILTLFNISTRKQTNVESDAFLFILNFSNNSSGI